MSEVQGLLRSDGFVAVRQLPLRGMITVKGDLSATALKNVATGLSGVDFPGPRECNCVGDNGIAWMAPDEILLMVTHATIPDAMAKVAATLQGQHYLAADVSDARTIFELEGAGVREVIAKLAPVDLAPDVFPPSAFRRTRLGQVPAAFWLKDNQTAELICFRSVTQYVFDILTHAARANTQVSYF
ncbi:sarcosine oxidase subunit gamma [Litoreibacter roseus]|uniref:Sarcosine oxidase subunit gamma n=1 Tax=Litoreibacter roseus TaxID=2601869 RepID=A0A6N6JC71_9RHOB|nr:sarcosine oxidase subunit gamma family protein [Litoreibacter roseus]GFE63911.1 sarcosine oxidase subunit gamma [Litoreibacter roseus]